MRLTRLQLRNWRNFKQLDVELGSRLFVVGPNASGKSNLLDALRFLADVSGDGGLQSAITKRAGLPRVRCLAARSYNKGWVQITIDLQDDQDERWQYDLAFSGEGKGSQRPVVKLERVTRSDVVILDRPNSDDLADPERLTQTHLEQVQVNKEFRVIAEFTSAIRYLHLVPQVIRDSNRSGGQLNDPYGGDFLARVARTPEKTQKARLRSLNAALKHAVPQLDGLELVRDALGVPHLQGRYKHWRTAGAQQNEAEFSDGTLRLIGLLWSLLEAGRGGGLLLLEEPELSLHSSLVRQLPSMFSRLRRTAHVQIVVSTHAPEIVGDEGIGLDEVLVLSPGEEGTVGQLAKDIPGVSDQIGVGLGFEDIVNSLTEPPDALKLSLFG